MPSEFSLLRSLVGIVDRHFPKRSQVINLRQNDVYSRIYNEFLNPEVVHEELLIDRIALEPTQRSSFPVLRNQFKEKLFNMLFMLDLSEESASKYRRAIYNNARDVFISQTLMNHGLIDAAARVARSALKEAKEFELTTNAIHFLRVLRYQAAIQGKKELYKKLSEEKKHFLDRYSCELEAREHWELLTVELSITGGYTEAIKKQAASASEQIGKIYENYRTFNIGLEYFRVTAMALELAEEYEAAEKLCDEAFLFLDAHPNFNSPSLYGVFALRMLECALHTGNYTAAEGAAKRCQALYPAGDTNWFFYMEYEFQLRMHLLKFEEAAKTLSEVTQDDKFELLQESRRQRWELLEFYLEYAQGKFTDLALAKRRLSALGRYKLASTAYTKDKSGYNLPILIIEFLILLESKQFDKLAEKADAFRVYRQRYLKNSPASSAFLQFLIIVAKNTGDPEAIRKWLKKEGENLEKNIGKPTSNVEGVQILRFSWLEERIIKSLGVV